MKIETREPTHGGHMSDIVERRKATLKVAERVKGVIRRLSPGGCRKLSMADECDCPLCDIDQLTDEIERLRALLDSGVEGRAVKLPDLGDSADSYVFYPVAVFDDSVPAILILKGEQ